MVPGDPVGERGGSDACEYPSEHTRGGPDGLRGGPRPAPQPPASNSSASIRGHSWECGVHFDGTSEDVQIERLNLLTREFQLGLRREQGYNIVAVHVAVRRNVQSASVPLKKTALFS